MTAVAERKATPVAQFAGQMDKMRAQILAALPKHVDLDKFVRVVMNAVQTSPILLTADRQSLLRACIEAATDGLIPDGREGAIVPYKGKAQWQPMVWGLVKLVRQSGDLESIGANIVRDGDEFSHWIDENGEHFRHVPAYGSDDKPMKLVYAFAKTKGGGVYFEAMSAAEIDKFRKLSKASSADSPWSVWPDEMAKVRPIKRLCKRLPMTVDALAAIERDNLRDAEAMGAAPKATVIDMLNTAIAGGQTAEPVAVEHRKDEPPADADFVAEMNRAEQGS